MQRNNQGMMGTANLKTPQKRILLVIVSCLILSIASAQNGTITSVNASLSDTVTIPSIPSDSLLRRKGIAIEIFKIKTNKKYVFKIGSVLLVMCADQKGRSRMKRAELTDITGDEFTFTPINEKFNEATYTPATLAYVEFVTPGTFFRGLMVNTVIVGVIVVVTTFLVIESLLSGSSPRLGNPDWIPFDDFHRHIRLKSIKKTPKWGVRAVYAIP